MLFFPFIIVLEFCIPPLQIWSAKHAPFLSSSFLQSVSIFNNKNYIITRSVSKKKYFLNDPILWPRSGHLLSGLSEGFAKGHNNYLLHGSQIGELLNRYAHSYELLFQHD